MKITLSENRQIDKDKVINLYRANKWSSVEKPTELLNALKNSHSLDYSLGWR